MSKGPPTKPPKRKPDLGPIDEQDVEDAFSSIRLGSEPVEPKTQVDDEIGIGGEEEIEEDSLADITGADELTSAHDELVVGGAEFAPEHTELADVRKADSPSRRAQTNPAILDEIIDENYERPVQQVRDTPSRSAPTVGGGRFKVSVPKTIPPPNKSKAITGDAAMDDPPTDAWAQAKYKEVPEGRAQPRAMSQAGTDVSSRRTHERAMTAAEKAAHAAKSRLAAKQGQAAPSTSPRQPTQASPAVRAVAQRQPTQATSPSRVPAPEPERLTQATSRAPQRVATQMAAVSPQATGPVQRTSASIAAASPQPPGAAQATGPVQRASASIAAPTPTGSMQQQTGPVQRTSASIAEQLPHPTGPMQRVSASMAAAGPESTGPIQRTSAAMPAVGSQPMKEPTGPMQRTSASVATQMPRASAAMPAVSSEPMKEPTGPMQRTSASVATQIPRTTPPGPPPGSRVGPLPQPPGSRVERLPLPPPRPSTSSFDEGPLEASTVAIETPAALVAASIRAQTRAPSIEIDVQDLDGGRGGTLDRALDSALATRDEDLEADDAEQQAALERALADDEEDLDDDFGDLAEPLPAPPEPQPVPQAAAPRLPRVDLAVRNKPQPVVKDVKPAEVEHAVAHSADFAVEVPVPLRVAVHETAPNLQSVGLAIAGAGHLMTLGASGREGLAKIHKACTQGEIDAVIVGMPGGEWLIQAALSLGPRAPIVIAACDGKPTDAIRTASAAGATLVAMRPHDPARIAPVLLAASRMAENRRDMSEAREKEASLIARLDSQAEDHEAELGDLQPFDTFKRTLELELKRVKRYQYALSVALFALEVPEGAPAGVRGLLRARAGNALVQSIRDIDMATVLDGDRFLVLLPYTDLTGATHVAKRILSAVDALPAIKMGGITVQAQLTGAIAGAKPGSQVSLGKLMKDATRALEAARRDGAELAVQP